MQRPSPSSVSCACHSSRSLDRRQCAADFSLILRRSDVPDKSKRSPHVVHGFPYADFRSRAENVPVPRPPASHRTGSTNETAPAVERCAQAGARHRGECGNGSGASRPKIVGSSPRFKQANHMTKECITPLRRRLIEDMTVRNFAAPHAAQLHPHHGLGAAVEDTILRRTAWSSIGCDEAKATARRPPQAG